MCCGGVLLSHTLPGAVPSALAGLASRFGMEAGRFPAAMTTTRWFNHIHFNAPKRVRRARVGRAFGVGVCVGCDPYSGDEHSFSVCQPCGVNSVVDVFVFSVGPLVPVGSRAPRGASTSGLSTRSSAGGLPPQGGCGNLISKQVSRLDAFSGYLSRT